MGLTVISSIDHCHPEMTLMICMIETIRLCPLLGQQLHDLIHMISGLWLIHDKDDQTNIFCNLCHLSGGCPLILLIVAPTHWSHKWLWPSNYEYGSQATNHNCLIRMIIKLRFIQDKAHWMNCPDHLYDLLVTAHDLQCSLAMGWFVFQVFVV